MATKSSPFSSVISGSPMITSEKLVGSENYLSWFASMELWFMGQGYEDHLVTQEVDIPEIASLKEEFLTVMPLTTDVGDQRIQIDKFFMVLTLIGLRPNLETIRDQILGSSSVPFLDDMFACLLRISSTQTLPSDNTSYSSVLVSKTNSRGGRSGNRGRGQRPHYTYCNKLGHTRDRVFSSLTVSMTTIFAIRPPSQLLLLLLPRLDRSTGKTIGIGRESQGLYHLTSSSPAVCISTDAPLLIHSHLGHPSLSKATKCIFLGYSRLQKGYHCYSSETHRYFLSADVTFFEDSPFFSTSESLPISEVLPLPIISPPDAVPSHPLQVYHRRHHVTIPPSLARDWQQAMVDEMAALHFNGTWDLVVLPSGKSIVGCRWVYTVKVGLDGQVDRLKARLVAKGYTQILKCFLHGDLAEEVYMEQPPGFVAQRESGLVCRLRCSLYGLKQSPQAWFNHFSSVVQEFAMYRSTTDHSVFCHHNSLGQCIYLVVYVDDILITGSDQNGIQNLKQHLFTYFQTKDLGKLKYCLGIEIAQSNTPMDPNVKLIPGQGEPLGDPGDIGDFKKQDVVARSSAKVKYRAMALATCELIWLKHLLRELRFGKDEQMKLICDN
ncbi:Retrovirus-related Pol polyprotein from transposon RE1 [Vitis vinifera]|uniref:Retrovirus-related Pol polyprotein from transposon RE1 n=1 Tax=Vitis vinifera TaxID=29760 RepID=A0A438H5D8_VITVI|nr:Retrovirus-related Pol polyprotein from transposon RE1 [Vitis vinifera]